MWVTTWKEARLYMSTATVKKYRWTAALAVVLTVGVVFFFYRMYEHDMKTLTDFSVSYAQFDKAVSGSSLPEADEAFVELNRSASVRISSLTKHDREAMDTMHEIADISEKELGTLHVYKKALEYKQTADASDLAKELRNLHDQRATAYAHFQELGG